MQWNPTERTNVVGKWEHRFFGSSYLFTFDHRTPLSSINVQASRNTTSYPQQYLSVPATGNVPLMLNFLLLSRFPDPVQRLNAINQIVQDQGLPNDTYKPGQSVYATDLFAGKRQRDLRSAWSAQ